MSEGVPQPRRRPQSFAPVIFAGAIITGTIFNLFQFSNWMSEQGEIWIEFPAPQYGDSYAQKAAGTKFAIYKQVKRHFTGWCLIGFEKRGMVFLNSNTLNFVGPAAVEIIAYDPSLTRTESSVFMAQVLERVSRHGQPDIGVVPPPTPRNNGTVVALRAKDGLILLVPLEAAPSRFAGLGDGQ